MFQNILPNIFRLVTIIVCFPLLQNTTLQGFPQMSRMTHLSIQMEEWLRYDFVGSIIFFNFQAY